MYYDSKKHDMIIQNKGSELDHEDIARIFPKFYEDNKEGVDSGRIIFRYDPYATETGCIVDLDTLESLIFDMRA